MKNFETIKECTELMIMGFNAISTNLLEKIISLDIDSWNELTVNEEDFDSYLPIWGTMWEVDESTKNFIENNLELISSLGFRIYYYEEENSLYIGIDGAGYDFYEAHWIPLYKAMGLQWHDEEN